ncbi:MAG TPA: XdhC family protein [Gammaproteobacteria bacterium]|nr:XdhC family protein [Gammaproteobacteria bacterium]
MTDLDSGQQELLTADRARHADSQPDPLPRHARQALMSDECLRVSHDGRELFIQPFNPPLRLVIIGAVHIAQYLADFAHRSNLEVYIIDPRQAFANSERFPYARLLNAWPDEALRELPPDSRTAVVSLAHDPKLDDPALHRALNSPAFYIGALGSRKTAAARNQRLAEAGFTADRIAAIHGPAGLAIGAASPAEIAISILAEIIKTLHQPDCA